MRSIDLLYFSKESFEKLSFPLNPRIYVGIDREFRKIESMYPGVLEHLSSLFDLTFSLATTESAIVPNNLKKYGQPNFDIVVAICESNFKSIRSSQNYTTAIVEHNSFNKSKGSHLVVNYLLDNQMPQAFITPLQSILKHVESKICRKESYQVYEHKLIKKPEYGVTVSSIVEYLDGSRSYVGVTKRTWQKRFQEHTRASKKNSKLLFHRGLRGELFEIGAIEHIVLRAGLTSSEAKQIERIEVEKRTLASKFNGGLNMIPGGRF